MLGEEGMGLLPQANTLACEGARWQLGGSGKLLRFSVEETSSG